MATPARLDGPGTYHHVWAHALHAEPLFVDDVDRVAYLAIAAAVFRKSSVLCVAYCLMHNHVHFVVRSGATHLSAVFLRLHTTYAVRYNRRHARRGPVFRARFGSRMHGDEDPIGTTIAYVHLNACDIPGLNGVADLVTYPWSGHRALMGCADPVVIDVPATLRLFGDSPAVAREALLLQMQHQLIAKRDRESRPTPAALELTRRAQRDERAFGVVGASGDGALVRRRIAELESASARLAAWRRRGGTLDRLVDVVCDRLGAERAAIVSGRRSAHEADARAVLAFVACDHLGLRCSDVARATRVTVSAICRARERGRAIVGREGLDAGALAEGATVRPD